MYVANLLSAAAARNKFRFDYNNIGRLIRAVQSIRFTPTLCWGERETTSRLTKSPLTSRRWGCEAYFIFEEEEERGRPRRKEKGDQYLVCVRRRKTTRGTVGRRRKRNGRRMEGKGGEEGLSGLFRLHCFLPLEGRALLIENSVLLLL